MLCHYLSGICQLKRNLTYLSTVGCVLKQAVSDNPKLPSNVPPSVTHEAASGSTWSFDTLRAPLVDHSLKKEIGISSNAVTERCPLKDDCTNKSGKSTDQITLKFRIKMKSDMSAKKNAAIYSGLGLDNSPSSSMGNSPEESEGMPPLSQETVDESPTGIIQVVDLSISIHTGLSLE